MARSRSRSLSRSRSRGAQRAQLRAARASSSAPPPPPAPPAARRARRVALLALLAATLGAQSQSESLAGGGDGLGCPLGCGVSLSPQTGFCNTSSRVHACECVDAFSVAPANAACAARACPAGPAWFGMPERVGADDAAAGASSGAGAASGASVVVHTRESATCSGRGRCDAERGACACASDFEGHACQRSRCPVSMLADAAAPSGAAFDSANPRYAPCSGHGRCVSLRSAGRGARGPRGSFEARRARGVRKRPLGEMEAFSATRDVVVSLQLASQPYPVDYNGWEADRLFGCVCDEGYGGVACDVRTCPLGTNALYRGRPDTQALRLELPGDTPDLPRDPSAAAAQQQGQPLLEALLGPLAPPRLQPPLRLPPGREVQRLRIRATGGTDSGLHGSGGQADVDEVQVLEFAAVGTRPVGFFTLALDCRPDATFGADFADTFAGPQTSGGFLSPSRTPSASGSTSVTRSGSATPSPTPTLSLTPSQSPTPSLTVGESPSETPSPSATQTPTPTPSPSPSASDASYSKSRSITASVSRSKSFSSSSRASDTPSRSGSVSDTGSESPIFSASPTLSVTQSTGISPSPTGTRWPGAASDSASSTASVTGSATRTPSVTPTRSLTNSGSESASGRGSASRTPTWSDFGSLTPSRTPTVSFSSSSSQTETSPTRTPSQTPTTSASVSGSASSTGTDTTLPSASASESNTETATMPPTDSGSPSGSLTPTATPTSSPSPSATETPTISESISETRTGSASVSVSFTSSPSFSPSTTASAGLTVTRSNSRTPTKTPTQTRTPSTSFSRTSSISRTGTDTTSQTPTLTPSRTGTPTPSQTQTPTNTPTQSATSSWTTWRQYSASATATPSLTLGASPSGTQTPSPTRTPSLSQGASPSHTSTASFSATNSVSPSLSSSVSRSLSRNYSASPSQSFALPSRSYSPERPHDPGCRMWGRARRVLAQSERVYLPANASMPAGQAAAQLADAVRAAIEGLVNIAADGQVSVTATLADSTPVNEHGGAAPVPGETYAARYVVTVVFAGELVGGDVPLLQLDASGVHAAPGGMLTSARARTAQDGSEIRGRVHLTWDDAGSYPTAGQLHDPAGALAAAFPPLNLSACAGDDEDGAVLAPQGPQSIFFDASSEPAEIEDAVLRAVFACAPAPAPLWFVDAAAGVGAPPGFDPADWRTFSSAANFTRLLSAPPCVEPPPLPWDEAEFGGDDRGGASAANASSTAVVNGSYVLGGRIVRPADPSYAAAARGGVYVPGTGKRVANANATSSAGAGAGATSVGAGGAPPRSPLSARPAVRVEVRRMIGGGPDLEIAVFFLRGVRARGDVAPLTLQPWGTTLALVSRTTSVAGGGVEVDVEEVRKGEFVDPASSWGFRAAYLAFPGRLTSSAPLGPFPWCADPAVVQAALAALDAKTGALGLVHVSRVRAFGSSSGSGGGGEEPSESDSSRFNSNGTAVATDDATGAWRGQYEWQVTFLSLAEDVAPLEAGYVPPAAGDELQNGGGPVALASGAGYGRVAARKLVAGNEEVPTSEVQLIDCACPRGAPAHPSASSAPDWRPTPSASRNDSPTPSVSPSVSTTASPSASVSDSKSPSMSASASTSPSASASESTSLTTSASVSAWPSSYASASPSAAPPLDHGGGCFDRAAHTVTLRFRGAETAPIPFSASPEELRRALAALPSVPDVRVSMHRAPGSPGEALGLPLRMCDAFGVTTAVTFSHNAGPQEPLEVARSGLPRGAVLSLLRAPAVGRFGGRARGGTHMLETCSGRGSCGADGTCTCYGDGYTPQWQASDGGAWPDAEPLGPADRPGLAAAKFADNCGAPLPPVSRCPGVVQALAGSTSQLAPGVKLIVLLGGGSEGECGLRGSCSGAPLWTCRCDRGFEGAACENEVTVCGLGPAWFDVPARSGGGFGGATDGPPRVDGAAARVSAHRTRRCAARGECVGGKCACQGRWAGRACELSPCPGGERLAPNPAPSKELMALGPLAYRRAAATTDCANAMPCVTQGELARGLVAGGGAAGVLGARPPVGAGTASQALLAAGARGALTPGDDGAEAVLALDLVLRPAVPAGLFSASAGRLGGALAGLVAARLGLLRGAVVVAGALESPSLAATAFPLLSELNRPAFEAQVQLAENDGGLFGAFPAAPQPLASNRLAPEGPRGEAWAQAQTRDLWNASLVDALQRPPLALAPETLASAPLAPNDWVALRLLLQPAALDAAAAAARRAAGLAPLAPSLWARLDAELNRTARLQRAAAAALAAAAAGAPQGAALLAPLGAPFPEPPGSLLGDLAALWARELFPAPAPRGGADAAAPVGVSGAFARAGGAPAPLNATAARLGAAAAAAADAAATAADGEGGTGLGGGGNGLVFAGWDAEMLRGCACDAYALRAAGGFARGLAFPTGAFDCSELECPFGPDPQRPGRAPRDVQRVACRVARGGGRVRFGLRGLWTRWLDAGAPVADADAPAPADANAAEGGGVAFESALRALNTSGPFLVLLSSADSDGREDDGRGEARDRAWGSAGVAREGGGARALCDGAPFFVVFLGSRAAPPLLRAQLDEAAAAGGGAVDVDVVQQAAERASCNGRGVCDAARGACVCQPGYGPDQQAQVPDCSVRNNFFGLDRPLPRRVAPRGSATIDATQND